jgi:RNA polymerase sigma-70 factor (ECF subfamily)
MDRDLVARAQHGDERAFESLTVATYPRLYRVAQGILRDGTLAEDATQAAIVRIWRNLRRLRDPSKFEGWSYRLLVNACHDEARRAPRWTPAQDLPPANEPLAPGDSFGAIADRDQLERGFRRISVDHRAVIVLHYLLDLPLERIAETLDVPLGTVASRLDRAMRSLRAALDAEARATTRVTNAEVPVR